MDGEKRIETLTRVCFLPVFYVQRLGTRRESLRSQGGWEHLQSDWKCELHSIRKSIMYMAPTCINPFEGAFPHVPFVTDVNNNDRVAYGGRF